MWDNPDSQDSQWRFEEVSPPSTGCKRKAEVLDVLDDVLDDVSDDVLAD